MSDLPPDAVKYAPVLERMVEIMGDPKSERVTFGDAMKRAAEELGIEVPEHMHEPLLVMAFRVISSGRIPGAADA